MKYERLFNNGDWTEARFNSFVKSALRAASRRWPPKFQALAEACVGPRMNVKTGRMAKHYLCAGCGECFPAKEVQVDHIDPIIDPVRGFEDWDTVIYNLYCEKDNLQVLCIDPCHKAKSAAEKQQAKERRQNAK